MGELDLDFYDCVRCSASTPMPGTCEPCRSGGPVVGQWRMRDAGNSVRVERYEQDLEGRPRWLCKRIFQYVGEAERRVAARMAKFQLVQVRRSS